MMTADYFFDHLCGVAEVAYYNTMQAENGDYVENASIDKAGIYLTITNRNTGESIKDEPFGFESKLWKEIKNIVKGYDEVRQCPICKKFYVGYPALLRRDNKTKICPDCGVQEALDDYLSFINEAIATN